MTVLAVGLLYFVSYYINASTVLVIQFSYQISEKSYTQLYHKEIGEEYNEYSPISTLINEKSANLNVYLSSEYQYRLDPTNNKNSIVIDKVSYKVLGYTLVEMEADVFLNNSFNYVNLVEVDEFDEFDEKDVLIVPSTDDPSLEISSEVINELVELHNKFSLNCILLILLIVIFLLHYM